MKTCLFLLCLNAHLISGAIAAEQETPTRAPVSVALMTQMPGFIPMLQGSRNYRKGFAGAALEEWKASAKWGHKQSQLLLGLLLIEGAEGVAKDWTGGHAWITLAASRGSRQALEYRDKLWSVMTQEERLAASESFDQISPYYGDAAVTERLKTWYRKEYRRSRFTQILLPYQGASLVQRYDERFQASFLGELYPQYDVLYRDFEVIEPAALPAQRQ